MVKIAVIGGSGVYDPDMLENVRQEVVETPYGEVSLQIGTYAGKEVAFLARHGSHHCSWAILSCQISFWILPEIESAPSTKVVSVG